MFDINHLLLRHSVVSSVVNRPTVQYGTSCCDCHVVHFVPVEKKSELKNHCLQDIVHNDHVTHSNLLATHIHITHYYTVSHTMSHTHTHTHTHTRPAIYFDVRGDDAAVERSSY